MQGARRWAPDGDATRLDYQPGDYAKDEATGWWFFYTPNGLPGTLRDHGVQEHEDGTITVSPSILVRGPGLDGWHGFLERGVWREC